MFCPVTMRMGRIFAYALTGICAFRLAMRRMFVVNLSFVLSTLWSAVACVAFQLESAAPYRYRPAPARRTVASHNVLMRSSSRAIATSHQCFTPLIEQIPPDTLLRHGHVFKLHDMPYIVDGDPLIVELNAAFVSFGFVAPIDTPTDQLGPNANRNGITCFFGKVHLHLNGAICVAPMKFLNHSELRYSLF